MSSEDAAILANIQRDPRFLPAALSAASAAYTQAMKQPSAITWELKRHWDAYLKHMGGIDRTRDGQPRSAANNAADVAAYHAARDMTGCFAAEVRKVEALGHNAAFQRYVAEQSAELNRTSRAAGNITTLPAGAGTVCPRPRDCRTQGKA